MRKCGIRLCMCTIISCNVICFRQQRILLQNGGKLHVKDIGDGIVESGLVPPRLVFSVLLICFKGTIL